SAHAHALRSGGGGRRAAFAGRADARAEILHKSISTRPLPPPTDAHEGHAWSAGIEPAHRGRRHGAEPYRTCGAPSNARRSAEGAGGYAYWEWGWTTVPGFARTSSLHAHGQWRRPGRLDATHVFERRRTDHAADPDFAGGICRASAIGPCGSRGAERSGEIAIRYRGIGGRQP